jgi:hypothetical protein
MKHKIYKVKKGQTLEDIASETGIIKEKIVQYHNFYCTINDHLILNRLEDNNKELYFPIETEILVSENEENNYSINFNKEARYRCEQTVFTKINEIPTNTAETKRDFLIKRAELNNLLYIEVSILDNIVIVNPSQYQEAVNLVSNLDLIKCEGIILQVNKTTGNIDRIINHSAIIEKWIRFKENLENSFDYVLNPKSGEAINNFIKIAHQQITVEKNLIDDLKMKMFFDIFFNKYLVDTVDKTVSYERNFYSQLFLEEKINLKINQEVLSETDGVLKVRKLSSFDDSIKNSISIKKQYEEKYQPIIHYKFSEFNTNFSETSSYDTEEGWLKESELHILEEVKNNIQLVVNYSLKKIE